MKSILTWLVVGLLYALPVWFGIRRPPIITNWWKPHRWLSQEVTKHYQEEEAAYKRCMADTSNRSTLALCLEPSRRFVSYLSVGVAGETATFDICLEHGELKRIK